MAVVDFQEGARSLRVTRAARWRSTPRGTLRDAPPVIFQDGRVIETRYITDGTGYGFALGAYDHTMPLVIDPGLAYSTLLGGCRARIRGRDHHRCQRDAYVTGFTQSPDFPTTAGAYDRTGAASNNLDVFVTKLNATGSALVYSTRLGGEDNELPEAIQSTPRATPTWAARPARPPSRRLLAPTTRPRTAARSTSASTSSRPSSTPPVTASSSRRSSAAPRATSAPASRRRAGNAYLVGSTLSPDFPGVTGRASRSARPGLRRARVLEVARRCRSGRGRARRRRQRVARGRPCRGRLDRPARRDRHGADRRGHAGRRERRRRERTRP